MRTIRLPHPCSGICYQRISGGRGGGRGGGGGGGGGGRGRNGYLVAFLGALNDDGFDRTVPDRVPSGLKVGEN